MPATITPSPLPLCPFPPQQWSKQYNFILETEHYAMERLAANPFGRQEKANLVFARVAGFLLIELFKESETLSFLPCSRLKSRALLPCATHELVFDLGRWFLDCFISKCALGPSPVSFSISVCSQTGSPPGSARVHPHPLRVYLSTAQRT